MQGSRSVRSSSQHAPSREPKASEVRVEAVGVGSRVGLGAVLHPPYRPALHRPLDTLPRARATAGSALRLCPGLLSCLAICERYLAFPAVVASGTSTRCPVFTS